MPSNLGSTKYEESELSSTSSRLSCSDEESEMMRLYGQGERVCVCVCVYVCVCVRNHGGYPGLVVAGGYVSLPVYVGVAHLGNSISRSIVVWVWLE